MPYIAEMAEATRGFTPSFDAYFAAFGRIAEIDAEATRWFARFPVALCPVAPDVAPPLGVFAFPPVDGEPPQAGRQALPLRLRQRARAARARAAGPCARPPACPSESSSWPAAGRSAR